MNKIIIYLALTLLLSPVIALADPSIEFASERATLGDVVEGQKAEHIYEFTNNGSDELVIEKLIPT